MRSLILSPNFLSPFFRMATKTLNDFDREYDLIPSDASVFNTKFDISETNDAVKITAELPGVKKEDISVNIDSNNVLTVKGEKKQEQIVDKSQFHLTERVYGKFERRFMIPEYVNTEDVKANFDCGILTLTLAKKAEKKSKEIAISVE